MRKTTKTRSHAFFFVSYLIINFNRMSNEYSRDLINLNKEKSRLNICFLLNSLDSNDEQKPSSSSTDINSSLTSRSEVDESVSNVNTNVDSSTPTGTN